MIWGVAGLRPNFFSSGRILLAELAQESWRDLAAVDTSSVAWEPSNCVHVIVWGRGLRGGGVPGGGVSLFDKL
jgi:hypothetical protein